MNIAHLCQHIHLLPTPLRPALRHLVAQGDPLHRPGHLLRRLAGLLAGQHRHPADRLPRVHRRRRRRPDERRPDDRQRRRAPARARQVPGDTRIGGRAGERHRACHRRCSGLSVRRFLAVDLQTQPAADGPDDAVLLLLHAAAQGRGRLARQAQGDRLRRLSARFGGHVRPPTGPDLGRRRVRVGFEPCHRDAGRGMRRVRAVCAVAVEGHEDAGRAAAHLQGAHRQRRLSDHVHQRVELPRAGVLHSDLLSAGLRLLSR